MVKKYSLYELKPFKFIVTFFIAQNMVCLGVLCTPENSMLLMLGGIHISQGKMVDIFVQIYCTLTYFLPLYFINYCERRIESSNCNCEFVSLGNSFRFCFMYFETVLLNA